MSVPRYVQGLATIIAVPVLAYLLFECYRATREEGGRMFVIIVLCMFSMVFWGFFELQGSTVIRFAAQHINMRVLGWELPTAWVVNFINPFLIILLGIPFSWLWVWLDRKHIEPSTPLKFSLGLLQLGLGFLVLWIPALQARDGGQGPLIWLLLGFLLFTTGELCLSPVGLSMVTKLAPARLVGVFMGMWFLSSALANVITGGVVGPMTAKLGYAPVFLRIGAMAGGAALLLFLLTPLLKRLMHGVK